MPARSQKRQKEADIAEISQVKIENQAKRLNGFHVGLKYSYENMI